MEPVNLSILVVNCKSLDKYIASDIINIGCDIFDLTRRFPFER